ncbi:MAG: AAA family ATPase [Candidatus Omnitrophica bacterium]|nr:AAA family ATPase [Candidatus Omnitrophota bacterium]
MSYYKVLGLQKEPFSTSPDPYFFYPSVSHETALKRAEIALRLRRGLSVILGDVGAGKTTLSRALINAFRDEPEFIFHMILDPVYESEYQFLHTLVNMFGIVPPARSEKDFKDALERYLFNAGVEEQKTVVLIIDEGQKMSPESIEVLRTLLNYETNEYKLLQLVIMAQMEFIPRTENIHNFTDRITLRYVLNSLDEEETGKMIRFRLQRAGYERKRELFTAEAVKLIYLSTHGHPRKIAMLCHYALETLIMKERDVVDGEIVEGLVYDGSLQ